MTPGLRAMIHHSRLLGPLSCLCGRKPAVEWDWAARFSFENKTRII